jgi:peroxiredoxin Q/BCP
MSLKVGDKAPLISGIDQNGEAIDGQSLMGQKVVLYFYPKDDTPGCTKEACNLRDNYAALKKEGYEVIGVSPDPVAKHKKFEEKYELPFRLIADPEKKLIESYDAWGLKKFMGREYMGVIRKTFLIDEAGKVERIIEKVKTKEHAEQILTGSD